MSQQVIDELYKQVGMKQLALDAVNSRLNDVENWYKNLMSFVSELKRGQTSIDAFEFSPDGTWKRTDTTLDVPAVIAQRNSNGFIEPGSIDD